MPALQTSGLWVYSVVTVDGEYRAVRISYGLHRIVAQSVRRYNAEQGKPPASPRKEVKVSRCVAELQGLPAASRVWMFDHVRQRYSVGRELLRRCWVDYMATVDGVEQLALLEHGEIDDEKT